MNKRLVIRCLGAFSVTLAGVEVTGFESDKARALLAFLATESEQAHHRERLAGLLWPDFDDPSARANLRRVLSNVRQVIGDRSSDAPALVIAGQTVQLNRAHVGVDVHTFQEKSAADNLAQLEEAVALCSGRFLDTLVIKDSNLFEDWLTLTRGRLQQQLMQTLGRLVVGYEQQGDWQKAAAFARQQLTLEPWHEAAHRQLMRVLAANGRRAEALKQYETCRSQLARELGVTPEPATISLYEQMRDGTLSARTAVNQEREEPGNLPTPVHSLVGRRRELAELSQLLLEKERRLLTILGLGGSGKTRLALAVGTAVRGHFRHGVYFVNLADHGLVEAIVPAIAEALRFTFFEGRPLQQQLADYLRQKKCLLILDNFEHLLAGSHALLDLLQAAPRLQIIVTSRERLGLQGEQLYPLAGLDVTAADGEAVQLFAHGAQLVEPDFVLSSENQTVVHRICRLVEGMPLALLLAASWITMLGPAEIVAELSQRTADSPGLDFLQTELRDVPRRQRSLRAVFDYSWRLLPTSEQMVCAQLAYFRGGFTYEAARAIVATSLRTLMRLVHRSFLGRRANGRFAMHELLRQFAAERLAQTPEIQAATSANHAHYFAGLVQQLTEQLHGAEQETALTLLEAENENIYLAWRWAVQHQSVEHLMRMMPGITLFFLWRHRYQEGAQWMAEAREQVVEDRELLAALTAVEARFQAQQQMHETAQALAQTAVTLTPANPFSHLQLGHTWLWHSTPDNSRRHFQQAQQGYRDAVDSWGEAQALGGLAETANMQGRYDLAQAQFEAALRLFEASADRRGQAWVLER
ncbi:MAG: BTAD domain-containing putative transcriptional regulator, partial [Candidatus Promineifilaceae bacterium]|nr:BTAD domain-containing putative transcriptional regulator [Candidatus Promineifilaceae bacterium]